MFVSTVLRCLKSVFCAFYRLLYNIVGTLINPLNEQVFGNVSGKL